jgi:hypothetical protein
LPEGNRGKTYAKVGEIQLDLAYSCITRCWSLYGSPAFPLDPGDLGWWFDYESLLDLPGKPLFPFEILYRSLAHGSPPLAILPGMISFISLKLFTYFYVHSNRENPIEWQGEK